MSDLGTRSNGRFGSSGIRLFGSQLDRTRGSTPQNDHVMPSMHGTSNSFYPRADQFGVPFQDEYSGSSMGFESRLGFGQLHPCSNRSSIGSDPCPSPYACREGIGPSRTARGGLHAP
ncbi:uncharacterized protein [Rutidosis leptorrhynchoides]|uniref:uncharacterized protein n=1 Tax=Rutidosis leptorrhynchoides TaxID=125765 RepID=UPI003A998BAA